MCSFPPVEAAKEDFKTLRSTLFKSKDDVYIRLNINREEIINLYKKIFQSIKCRRDIKKDGSGNQMAIAKLKDCLKYESIPHSYQCAHIFGRTKNPLLFTALFNLCFIPDMFASWTDDKKYKDDNEYRLEFRKQFYKKVLENYGRVIRSYNTDKDRIQMYEKIKKANGEEDNLPRWRVSLEKQWGELPTEYDESSDSLKYN